MPSVAIGAAGAGHVDAPFFCGDVRLVAEITTFSKDRLGLQTGMRAYAMIKSVMIDRAAG
ncbi:MAG: hypothetical protein GC153_13005 [Alphaproteobacteria bacterium]|nr:hypothetical protein [Alphaproteobacteria bacterium]